MISEDILKKAIEKAIKNGLLQNGEEISNFDTYSYKVILHSKIHNEGPFRTTYPVYDFIFSHSFAEAFWGEDTGLIMKGNKNPDCAGELTGKIWQYHLQQMVLEEDPIEYLEQFL